MTTEQNEGNVSRFTPQKYSLNLTDQIRGLNDEFEKFENIAKNPMALTHIFLGLKTAMDNFNNLLQELNKTLADMDARLSRLETPQTHDSVSLSKKDQEVLDYVMTHGQVAAEELQVKFSYKGKHAASARLHKLFAVGALDKIHAGRTVYYTAPKHNPNQNPSTTPS